MRLPHNVEKSAFRRGEYVGYAGGCWRITRHGTDARTWRSALLPQGEPYGVALAERYGATLAEIGEAITRAAADIAAFDATLARARAENWPTVTA